MVFDLPFSFLDAFSSYCYKTALDRIRRCKHMERTIRHVDVIWRASFMAEARNRIVIQHLT